VPFVHGGFVLLRFDRKTDQEIIFRGHVVMSRTEESYLRRLIENLRWLPVSAVLEVGYGLGISAGLIQDILRPACHHIIEIEKQLHEDCVRFSDAHQGVQALWGDCYRYRYPRFYDLLFFDPFDYDVALGHITCRQSFTREFNREVVLAHRVLRPGGLLCHTFFGDVPMPELAGFTLQDEGLFRERPFLLHTGSMCASARLGYYRKR
jgi:SAM-dependent methyltransferase